MEGDRAFQHDKVMIKGLVEKMRVELEIDRRVELLQQRDQRVAPA